MFSNVLLSWYATIKLTCGLFSFKIISFIGVHVIFQVVVALCMLFRFTSYSDYIMVIVPLVLLT